MQADNRAADKPAHARDDTQQLIRNMKKAIGSILCIVAVFLIVGSIVGQEADTTEQKIQNWAFIGLLLAVGVPLSSGKKPESTD